MLEENIDIDIYFNFNDLNTELVNLKNPINDSLNEIKTSFDNSELKNIIKKEVEKYFSCSKCSTIVSNTRVCQKCDRFYCGNYSNTISKCPTCKRSKKWSKMKV